MISPSLPAWQPHNARYCPFIYLYLLPKLMIVPNIQHSHMSLCNLPNPLELAQGQIVVRGAQKDGVISQTLADMKVKYFHQ